jgi:hypothetical protein
MLSPGPSLLRSRDDLYLILYHPIVLIAIGGVVRALAELSCPCSLRLCSLPVRPFCVFALKYALRCIISSFGLHWASLARALPEPGFYVQSLFGHEPMT